MSTPSQNKRGPHPERVKSNKDWKDAIKDALKKKRPEGGWPEPEKERKKDDED